MGINLLFLIFFNSTLTMHLLVNVV